MEDVITRPHQALLTGENELLLSELLAPPLYFKPRNPASFCTLLYSRLWVRFCLNKAFSGVGGGLSYTHTLSQKPRETNTGFKHSRAPVWPWTRQLIPPDWHTDPFNSPKPHPSHKPAGKNKMRNSPNQRNYTTIHCVPYELWIG